MLEVASQVLLERIQQFEGVVNVSDNYDKGKAQFDFTLLPEGRNLGLTPQEVGQQVRDAFFGALAMRQIRGTVSSCRRRTARTSDPLPTWSSARRPAWKCPSWTWSK